jgi:AraC-like DNA-binding protein
MTPPTTHSGVSAGEDAGTTTSSGALLNRVGAVAVLPDVLRDLGLDPAAVFAAAQVEMDALEDPEALLTVVELGRLVSLALHASKRPDLGLLAADRAGADMVGLLGDLFVSADDLRAALHDLIRYFCLVTRGGVAILNVEGPFAEIRIALTGPYGDAAVVFEDAVIGILFHSMRKYLGRAWRPTEVLLSHTSMGIPERYRNFFGAPVRFDALGAAILFPADDLSRPMFTRDMERRRLGAAAALASSRLAIGFDEQVRWTILAHLGMVNLTIDVIGGALGISRRTLNRRLRARDATFAQLFREVRFATARQLLVESDTPLAEIATAVGFGDPSTFSNAFRLWSGAPPREWRRLHGRG